MKFLVMIDWEIETSYFGRHDTVNENLSNDAMVNDLLTDHYSIYT